MQCAMRHLTISLVEGAVINRLHLIICETCMRPDHGTFDMVGLPLAVFINENFGNHCRTVFIRAERT